MVKDKAQMAAAEGTKDCLNLIVLILLCNVLPLLLTQTSGVGDVYSILGSQTYLKSGHCKVVLLFKCTL